MKKTALFLALSMGIASIPNSHAWAEELDDASTYSTRYIEGDDFTVVTNPNGGEILSYRNSNLLEVREGDYTYAFKDMNGNGELDAYEDWRNDSEARAEDITSQMSTDDKLGLMLLAEYVSIPEDGVPTEAQQSMVLDNKVRHIALFGYDSIEQYTTWYNTLQSYAESDGLGIPFTAVFEEMTSAVDMETALADETMGSAWPARLAIASTFNPEHVLKEAQALSEEYRAAGAVITLQPQIDLSTEPRWGRISGTFGEDVDLASDMASAYVSGMQSSWNGYGSDAEDLGWGSESVVTEVKHYPGDGAAEAGREAHNNFGKFNVYPGDNMDEHVAVFAATLNLDTKTGSSMGVMPSYSIAINKAGNAIGNKVASGFSSYKLTDILLDELGFDGVISSDFLITTDDMRPWGVEDLSYTMRHLAAMRAGMMQFGGEADLQVMRDAYELGILADRAGMQKTTDSSEGMPVFTHEYYTNDSECEWNEYITECAYKIVRNLLYTGIFENPYLSSENLRESNSNTESIEMGYEAQLDGVVMLKNAGNVLESASEEKKTVYMPMQINADAEASADIAQAHATGDWSSIGFEDTTYGGVISYAFDWDLANEYFNVVTDELSEEADLSNLTEEDIIRRTDFTDVDFALLNVTAPKNGSGYNAEAVNLDAEAGELDNGYYPISLIYNDYYADPEIVREYPLGVDDNEELEWIEAGGEMGKSRYYGGKTTPGNTADLDLILSTKERIGDLPLVVSITATGPFCLYEFEESTDAILVNFGVSSRAMMENIAGVHEPQGLLPIQLPANMETVETQYEDVARDMECHVDSEGNTYDFAYGMNFSGVINDERVATYK